MFIYKCGDLAFSGEATIGFVTEDGLFANHIATLRGRAQSVACLNIPTTPWVNVVYEITTPGGHNIELQLIVQQILPFFIVVHQRVRSIYCI